MMKMKIHMTNSQSFTFVIVLLFTYCITIVIMMISCMHWWLLRIGEGKLNHTQTYSVSVGVKQFRKGDGRAHDECSYKDPDDHSCVCRRGCAGEKRHDRRRRNEGRSSRFVGIPKQPSTPAPTGSLFKYILSVFLISVAKNRNICIVINNETVHL